MKLSFNEKIETNKTVSEQSAVASGPSSAVAVMEPAKETGVAVRGQYNDLDGEIGGDDLILPRINLTQKVGDLGDQFGPGVIVFQKELVIWKEGQLPLNLVILHAQKRYQESTEFGSDEMGQVVDTMEEVKNQGGWIEWWDGDDGKRQSPPWAPRLDVVCAVEAPEGADTSLFPFQFNGKSYAAAVWTLSKSAFTSAGRAVLTARATFLREGYRTGLWQVTTAKRQGPKGIYFVPAFRASEKTPEAFRDFLDSVYQG